MVRLWGQEVPMWLRAGTEDHCPTLLGRWEVPGQGGRGQGKQVSQELGLRGIRSHAGSQANGGFLSDRKM